MGPIISEIRFEDEITILLVIDVDNYNGKQLAHHIVIHLILIKRKLKTAILKSWSKLCLKGNNYFWFDVLYSKN